jgi:hypothetical protein
MRSRTAVRDSESASVSGSGTGTDPGTDWVPVPIPYRNQCQYRNPKPNPNPRWPSALRFSLAGALAACWLAASLAAEPVVVESILAVVDGRPVLLSEVLVVERVTGQDRERALEALIDERLMFREAARLPQAAVSPDEEDKALASLRARAAGPLDGLPERELRQLARRQVAILKYVEYRFRPQVRVDPATPPEERERRGEEDLRERIEAWVKELRAGAEVRYNVAPPPATARRGR